MIVGQCLPVKAVLRHKSGCMTNPSHHSSDRRTLWAYVLPFAVFMGGLALISLAQSFAPAENAPLWLAEPKYWVYPLQTILCGGLVLWFWRTYDWGASWHILTAVLTGLVVLALWVSPQWLLEAEPRMEGFNPDIFAGSAALYWGTLALRFVRLVVVVSGADSSCVTWSKKISPKCLSAPSPGFPSAWSP